MVGGGEREANKRKRIRESEGKDTSSTSHHPTETKRKRSAERKDNRSRLQKLGEEVDEEGRDEDLVREVDRDVQEVAVPACATRIDKRMSDRIKQGG